jgi:hypothetical protein
VKRLHLGAKVARTHMNSNGPLPPGVPVEVVPAQPHARGPFFDEGTVLDVAVGPLWLELIDCPATTFVVVNSFDCATAYPFNGAERRRRRMASALAGTFIILSIGILMVHAMDAFRSGS